MIEINFNKDEWKDRFVDALNQETRIKPWANHCLQESKIIKSNIRYDFFVIFSSYILKQIYSLIDDPREKAVLDFTFNAADGFSNVSLNFFFLKDDIEIVQTMFRHTIKNRLVEELDLNILRMKGMLEGARNQSYLYFSHDCGFSRRYLFQEWIRFAEKVEHLSPEEEENVRKALPDSLKDSFPFKGQQPPINLDLGDRIIGRSPLREITFLSTNNSIKKILTLFKLTVTNEIELDSAKMMTWDDADQSMMSKITHERVNALGLGKTYRSLNEKIDALLRLQKQADVLIGRPILPALVDLDVGFGNMLGFCSDAKWNRFRRFSWTKDGWSGSVPIEREYKFVICLANGTPQWEKGPNRISADSDDHATMMISKDQIQF